MTKKILIDETVVKQALEALEKPAFTHAAALQNLSEALELVLRWIDDWCETGPETGFDLIEEKANAALEVNNKGVNALADQAAEPVREMPSNTRYAVAVEGQALTYWDNIHDAITNAQRAVYAGPNETSRAIDDLKAGRLAEWSYGFSAVRIYPPQNTSTPVSKPLTDEQILSVARDHYNPHQRAEVSFARAIEAALGITGSKT